MWLYIWLIITVVALIVEFATTEMLSAWFAGGAIVAMILAGVGVHEYIQIPVFIVISFVLMLCFRRLVLKKFAVKSSRLNADSVIGKEFELLTSIDFNQPGTIRVNGIIWNVITQDERKQVPQGSTVKIIKLEGNKYVVEVI